MGVLVPIYKIKTKTQRAEVSISLGSHHHLVVTQTVS